jgi:uncharacterized membrane protein YgcG
MRTLALAVLAAGLLANLGCGTCCGYRDYSDIVDPCWPERYSAMSREHTRGFFETQTGNGLVLEQTVWNYHFREYSDTLSPSGQSHLEYLARRRPQPLGQVYLQTAVDLKVDPKIEKVDLAQVRGEMDAKRIKAVTEYLASIRPGVPFQVEVINPSPVGQNGREAMRAVRMMHQATTGSISDPSSGGSGGASGGATSGSGSGAGSGSGSGGSGGSSGGSSGR